MIERGPIDDACRPSLRPRDIKGPESVKRALNVAAAGSHNLLTV
ncbi:ATP-binding protein [Sinorhizobium meliloti]|nr:ATP-binding protein [Sinorhizobium meliloti]RVK93385.1 hypothetical protein CN152_23270 [Sinorhizobium meliloti]RVN34077.1 hypothetical protein CN113_35415 [Sinorhizobium meliloti]